MEQRQRSRGDLFSASIRVSVELPQKPWHVKARQWPSRQRCIGAIWAQPGKKVVVEQQFRSGGKRQPSRCRHYWIIGAHSQNQFFSQDSALGSFQDRCYAVIPRFRGADGQRHPDCAVFRDVDLLWCLCDRYSRRAHVEVHLPSRARCVHKLELQTALVPWCHKPGKRSRHDNRISCKNIRLCLSNPLFRPRNRHQPDGSIKAWAGDRDNRSAVCVQRYRSGKGRHDCFGRRWPLSCHPRTGIATGPNGAKRSTAGIDQPPIHVAQVDAQTALAEIVALGIGCLEPGQVENAHIHSGKGDKTGRTIQALHTQGRLHVPSLPIHVLRGINCNGERLGTWVNTGVRDTQSTGWAKPALTGFAQDRSSYIGSGAPRIGYGQRHRICACCHGNGTPLYDIRGQHGNQCSSVKRCINPQGRSVPGRIIRSIQCNRCAIRRAAAISSAVPPRGEPDRAGRVRPAHTLHHNFIVAPVRRDTDLSWCS